MIKPVWVEIGGREVNGAEVVYAGRELRGQVTVKFRTGVTVSYTVSSDEEAEGIMEEVASAIRMAWRE